MDPGNIGDLPLLLAGDHLRAFGKPFALYALPRLDERLTIIVCIESELYPDLRYRADDCRRDRSLAA